MRVEISPLAELDMGSIGDDIAEDNPVRALSCVAELRTVCAKIARAPQSFRARPEPGEGMRAWKPRDLFRRHEDKIGYRACFAWRDGQCSAIRRRKK